MSEEDKDERKDPKEYFKALTGLIVVGCIVLLLSCPVVALVLGFSVRIYRWAAGY
jgi:uncharacterized membrane protein